MLNSGPAVWIGKLSYSLYVWHLATAEAVQHWLAGTPHSVVAAVALAACVAMAALSYYGLEQPLIGLRRRFGSRAAERPALLLIFFRDQVGARAARREAKAAGRPPPGV